MPRWNKARRHSPPPRREELASTEDPASEHTPDGQSPIPSEVTTTSEERIDTSSRSSKKKRRNLGPLRLFRGGDSTRNQASSPKSESSSKELKPHNLKKNKGFTLFQRRNKRNSSPNKRSTSPTLKIQATTSEAVTHTDDGEQLFGTSNLHVLSQSLSDDVDRPFYKDACALPASLCCGVENAVYCLGFPCFVVQQVLSDFAALIIGEEIQAEYKPKECPDDDQTLDDDGITAKLQGDDEEEEAQEIVMITRIETESITIGESIQDDDDVSIEEAKQFADDDSTIEEDSISHSTSDDDTSIEEDSLENDASIDEEEPGAVYDEEQQVQNPSIEEFAREVPAMKHDWAFQDDVPEDEIDGMAKQEEEKSFQEEGSLLDNEEWAFLPEYATSTQELEQALEDSAEPEDLNESLDDQHAENKFEVFFSSEEWRRDLATEEQVRDENVSAVPRYEPREDKQEYGKDCAMETFERSPTLQPIMLFNLEEDVSAVSSYEMREDTPEDEREYDEDCVKETFEKSPTAQPTMLVNPNKNRNHHNGDVLEDPAMFVDHVQSI